LAHLAIYSGWPNAVSALAVYEQVYTARKIDVATLRVAAARLPASADDALPGASGAVAGRAPKFAQLTRDIVFDDLWRRTDLTPRDRSLATIAALASMGDADQLAFYVRRGLDAGLTHEQITEAVTHLGFYAGWGRATSAMEAIAAASPGAAR
jgi:4-carboxymuconolactone decarboxylase